MIHQYKLGGFNIVLDICSGGVHVVDDIAYDIIAMYEDSTIEDIVNNVHARYPHASESEIIDCYNQVTALKDSGKLFVPDTFEPKAGILKAKTSGVVKALCLHIAHTCNLNCAYCFASQGKYNGDRAVMSFEVGKQALDFLVAQSGKRHNLEVDFFGGEPLMNFDVVKQLVAYARSIEKEKGKNFRFTLTTNGMLINDDVIEFANKEMSNVVLSLDGRKEIHDRYRVDYSGKGSWERIVPKFQKLVKAREGKNYYMRGTFTHENPDFLEDIKTMLDLGFTELSMEPVVCAPGDPSELTPEDMEIVKDQYEKLAELMLQKDNEGNPFTFYHYMIDLKGGPCIYKRISGCGSGTEYMAVTPWGDLYPCHQFVGDEKYLLGNVWDGVTNTAIQEEFASCNVYARPDCKDCWAKLYCSGGCAANAYHATGSVKGVYKSGCDIFPQANGMCNYGSNCTNHQRSIIMNTPICDFVSHYASLDPLRLHMPGHKGTSLLGFETMDITEIDGADSLFEADGIIQKSEENASTLFGCRTFYSTEGSSLCIRAMLYLCMLHAKKEGRQALIAAARNVHSTFIRAAAMLDFQIHWLHGAPRDGYLSCIIEPDRLEHWLSNEQNRPVAVYLTSPDYLGNIADIQSISRICHQYGVLLLVDNAHGAYLKFLPQSQHPIDLGADLCCDSAHKTLCVLTGGAYLHIGYHTPEIFTSLAKQALAMFASTSPSYLILQSLDAVNISLASSFPKKLDQFLTRCNALKKELGTYGYRFIGDEPLKWTIDCKAFGYTGSDLAHHLKEKNIYSEFSDPDYLVLMLTPEIGIEELERLKNSLLEVPRQPSLVVHSPAPSPGKKIMTPRQAAFLPCENISVADSIGRILATPSVACPPAVPIVVCGEEINEQAVECFRYYGIATCCVTIP